MKRDFYFRKGYKLMMYPSGALANHFRTSRGGIEKQIWDDWLADNIDDTPTPELAMLDSMAEGGANGKRNNIRWQGGFGFNEDLPEIHKW